MSKSFDWTIEQANNPDISKLAGLDVSSAYELESEVIFRDAFCTLHDYMIPESPVHILKGGSIDSYKISCVGKNSYNVRIKFDANADFDYFTFWRELNDGTFAFEQELLKRTAIKVIALNTAYQPKIEKGLSSFSDIFWTVGNFVVVPEYDRDFGTKQKPWMRERCTVLLPLKMDVR